MLPRPPHRRHLTTSDESHEVRFVDLATVDQLPMVESIRLRLTDFIKHDEPAIR